ncbi:MAG: hypothetical protein GF370_02200 [Candidatus Nealsonbacteria bacterium]|nr:hypothetical protein [Candidatus Nealsonbacteria bacterium]
MEKPRKNKETSPDRKRDEEIKEALEEIAVPFKDFVKKKEESKELKELTPEEKKDLLDLLKKELEKKGE